MCLLCRTGVLRQATGFCKHQPVADRISDLAEDLVIKLSTKSFVAFSVAIDEHTDITDVA